MRSKRQVPLTSALYIRHEVLLTLRLTVFATLDHMKVMKSPISLLGMDVLHLFTKWQWNYETRELLLDT